MCENSPILMKAKLRAPEFIFPRRTRMADPYFSENDILQRSYKIAGRRLTDRFAARSLCNEALPPVSEAGYQEISRADVSESTCVDARACTAASPYFGLLTSACR